LYDEQLATEFCVPYSNGRLDLFAGLVLSVLIAWITVGDQSIKAAIANRVRSLRSE
jgi:hypothetical protein